MTQPKSLIENRLKKSPSNSFLQQWQQFLVQFVKRVMVDLKKKNTSHVSTSLWTNPNLYQTNELKKLEVGERGGNVLLQLLPQLVSPENNQKWNPEDNLGGRRNEVNETSLEVIMFHLQSTVAPLTTAATLSSPIVACLTISAFIVSSWAE